MNAPMQTQRLQLRPLERSDAPAVLQLLNDPEWLARVGDRGLRGLEDVEHFLAEGDWTRYASQGFGFYALERRGQPGLIGVCGLAQRGHLDAPDIGYGLLPEGRGQGLAQEAARAVLGFAWSLGLERLLATVRLDNLASQAVLEKLGMARQRQMQSPTSGLPLWVYSIESCKAARA